MHKTLIHPQACIQVRLSGPCFKTGRVLPFPLQAPRARMRPRTLARWGELPCPRHFRARVKRCCQARQDTLHTACSRPTATRMLTQQALAVVCSNLTKTWWLRSLHFQRLKALLLFFSKSCAPFPHGTCLPSILSPYLPLSLALLSLIHI